MSFPLFRFTLGNDTVGLFVISEPGGWDEAVLKLERNQEFHSLVEMYDQPMLFYGQSSEGNGGLDYIREIEKSQGPDAQITILIEVSYDEGQNYENVYDGLIDITSCKEIDFYKAEYGVIRNDFWQKFINRKGINVDLGATVDLDGNTISGYSPFTLSMPSQKIRQKFERIGDGDESSVYEAIGTTSYLIFGNANVSLDEISERFEYGTIIVNTLPTDASLYYFKVKWGGDYLIDLITEYTLSFDASRTYDVRWYYAIRNNDGTLTGPTQFGSTNAGTGTSVNGNSPTLNTTLTLNAGDELFIYGTVVLNSGTNMIYFSWDTNDVLYTEFSVSADTIYPNTTTSAYQILEVAKSIISKLTGVIPSIVSDYLASAGCGGYYALVKGLIIRGYQLSAKPFFMSFDDWWLGANPILNLGLGYINGENKIEIEAKEDFYDIVPIINFDWVNNIERSYNDKFIFKSIEVGYTKWSAESGSGIDDPQTKRVFRTRFKTIGQDIKLLSKFYAASLGIEQTRRNRVEEGKDWRLDEDIMIIALNKADTTLPELGGAFTSITGLLNSSTRYNIRLSASRIMRRWHAFLNGCLKWYNTNDDFVFSSGEGNFDMLSTLAVSDCEGDGVSFNEKGDIDAGADQDINFVPVVYTFEHPLTWNQYKAIRDTRKKAIGVSRTDEGHVPCHIIDLDFYITQGKAKFTVMSGTVTPL